NPPQAMSSNATCRFTRTASTATIVLPTTPTPANTADQDGSDVICAVNTMPARRAWPLHVRALGRISRLAVARIYGASPTHPTTPDSTPVRIRQSMRAGYSAVTRTRRHAGEVSRQQLAEP